MQERKWFEMKSVRLATEINFNNDKDQCWAYVKMKVGAEVVQTAAQGRGPVDACFIAMKKLLVSIYSRAVNIRLIKFSVPEKDVSADGSSATVTVYISLQYNSKSLDFEFESGNIEKACTYAFINGFRACLDCLY